MQGMILESRELTKKFGSVLAADRISLSLDKGHICAMLGPNGSGKTTWMKMAAGLLKPTSGEVYYDGKPVGIESRKEIAYVSTEPYFYNWMKVIDAGKYYADFFEDFSMETYSRLLKQMELKPGMKISSLSTGMTAKMKVAVTMARDAKVWMLDEPFNGIDLLARDEIRECIRKFCGPEKLMLISSHLVEELEAIADEAVFIREGRLVGKVNLEETRLNEGKSIADLYREIFGHAEE